MNNDTRPLTIDGLRPQAVRPPASAPTVQSQPPAKRIYFQPRPAEPERRWLKKLELPFLLTACIVGGFFADNLALGLGLLAIYGAYAFIARVPSRTTFTLTLLLLAAISLLLLLKPDAQLISNFASYAFVLLLIGVITLGREAKLPKRTKREYRR